MRNKISLILILVLISSIPLIPQETDPESKSRKTLEKSLLFPGWGQIHEKQYVKGVLFMAAETFCIIQSIIHDSKANQLYDKYKIAENSDDAVYYRNETIQFDKGRNAYMLAGAAIWIINLLDIYIFTNKKPKKGVKLFLKHDKDNKISFGFNYYF